MRKIMKNYAKVGRVNLQIFTESGTILRNTAGKFSKTGRFQTAGAAQPIELSKKRRHFQLGF